MLLAMRDGACHAAVPSLVLVQPHMGQTVAIRRVPTSVLAVNPLYTGMELSKRLILQVSFNPSGLKHNIGKVTLELNHFK